MNEVPVKTIAGHLSQHLAVHVSQVSRDERNEYHVITVDRAKRVLDALGAEMRTTVEHLTGKLQTA